MKPDLLCVFLILTAVSGALAAAMARTFAFLIRSVAEVHELRRKEAWKAEVLAACRRW